MLIPYFLYLIRTVTYDFWQVSCTDINVQKWDTPTHYSGHSAKADYV